MLTLVYLLVGTLFLWFFCRDCKKPKNWHALLALTLFSPLVLVWLVLELLKWAWSNLVPWLNEEI
jgi:RsiW-degrading membrane proteinase PrsW (M82 family)